MLFSASVSYNGSDKCVSVVDKRCELWNDISNYFFITLNRIIYLLFSLC